jgi:hypothetical protein
MTQFQRHNILHYEVHHLQSLISRMISQSWTLLKFYTSFTERVILLHYTRDPNSSLSQSLQRISKGVFFTYLYHKKCITEAQYRRQSKPGVFLLRSSDSASGARTPSPEKKIIKPQILFQNFKLQSAGFVVWTRIVYLFPNVYTRTYRTL